MKKTILFIMCIVGVLLLTGCNNSAGQANNLAGQASQGYEMAFGNGCMKNCQLGSCSCMPSAPGKKCYCRCSIDGTPDCYEN